MDERPFPHGPLPQAPPSRRGVLVVGALAVVAAGAGALVGVHHTTSSLATAEADTRELRAAGEAERELILLIDRLAEHAHGSRAALLAALRADHVAHQAAVRAAIADAVYPHPAPKLIGKPVAVPKPKLADLRVREQQATRAARTRAARLTGRSAALLASIAASEAIHVELLR